MSKKHVLRILSALLLLAVLCSLAACGDDDYYDPIKSSRLERTVIAELGEDEVNYELFRYLFMGRIDTLDGGDRTKWSGDGADALWQAAVNDIIPDICEIYAVFSVCRSWGIDPEGDNIEEVINQYIKADIDGGVIDGREVAGYGSVDAYKEALAASFCTDAVRRLLYRYSACLSSLYSYVAVNRAQGALTVDDTALAAFVTGEDCAHVNRVFLSADALGGMEAARTRAERIHADMLAAGDDYEELVRVGFIKSSTVDANPAAGLWFGRYSTDRDYCPAYYDTIFTIGAGEISPVIEAEDGYYIVYGMSRSLPGADDPDLRETLTRLTLEERYSREIDETAARLAREIVYTDDFAELTAARLMEGK